MRPRLAVLRALLLLGAAPFVHAAARAQGPLKEWALSTAPTVGIADDGTPATEFYQVTSAWRMSDGGLVVFNASSRELRVFDARGAYVRTFGRRGGGPGEFETGRWTSHAGDTAIVYDTGRRRVTLVVMSGTPRVVGEYAVPSGDGPDSEIVGRLGDGRWVMRSISAPNLRSPPGMQRLDGKVGLIDARMEGGPSWVSEGKDFGVIVRAPDAERKQVQVLMAPFPARLEVEAAGGALWIGDTAGDSLIRIEAATGAKRAFRLPDPAPALTTALVDAARARELRAMRSEEERPGILMKYSAENLPRNHPAFSDLVAGPGGEIWVKRRLPTTSVAGEAAAPGEYVVIGANGVARARLGVPARFRILDVGLDFVVGVQTDEDGVETVRAYGLTR